MENTYTLKVTKEELEFINTIIRYSFRQFLNISENFKKDLTTNENIMKKIKKLQTGIVLNHVNKNGVTKISINENKKYEN